MIHKKLATPFDQFISELESSLHFKGICLEQQTEEEKPVEEKRRGDSPSRLPPYLQMSFRTDIWLDTYIAGKRLKVAQAHMLCSSLTAFSLHCFLLIK